jgi:hypothetical protein
VLTPVARNGRTTGRIAHRPRSWVDTVAPAVATVPSVAVADGATERFAARLTDRPAVGRDGATRASPSDSRS